MDWSRFRALAPQVALMLAAACAPASTSLPAAPAPPGPGGVQLAASQKLTVGFPNVAPNLDPAFSISGSVRKFDIFESLVIIDERANGVEAQLATDWKTIDQNTWRFTLRRDAKFQDGTTLTADDVVYSYKRLLKPELKSPIPGYFPAIADIAAPDLSTIEVKTRTPDPVLLKRVTALAVVPRAYVEKIGDQEFGIKPMGSGPYKLVEFKSEDRVVLAKWNEHPFRKPVITDVVIRAIPDATARTQGIRLGELDIATLLSIEAGDSLKREGFTIDLGSPGIAGALLDTWGIDGTNVGPIADKRVRQAINYAINREALATTLYRGIQKPAGVLITDATNGYDPNLKPFTYDQQKAKTLLAEAGYANGLKIPLEFWPNSPEVQPTALFIQGQLKEVGIDLELVPIDFATFRDKIYKQKPIAPIYFGALNGGPFNDGDWLLTWFWSENRQFGKRYNSPEYDKVYLEGRQEMDPAKRETLLRRAAAILQDDPPWLGLVTTNQVNAAAKNLNGTVIRVDGWVNIDKIQRRQ